MKIYNKINKEPTVEDFKSLKLKVWILSSASLVVQRPKTKKWSGILLSSSVT